MATIVGLVCSRVISSIIHTFDGGRRPPRGGRTDLHLFMPVTQTLHRILCNAWHAT